MTVQRSPLEELCELARLGQTGEFVCATAGVELHVYLQRGRLAWATNSTYPFEFAKYIKEHSNIDDETFRQVVAECRREKQHLGATLVAWELAGWDEIQRALSHQAKLAIGALSQVPRGSRNLFLERTKLTEYDDECTVPIEAIVAELDVEPRRQEPVAEHPRARSLAWDVLGEIEDAMWVEVLTPDGVVDAAPIRTVESHVPMSLVRNSIDDSADFVGMRSTRGTMLGARVVVKGHPGSVWFKLAPNATYGAAVTSFSSLGVAVSGGSRFELSQGKGLPAWELGPHDSAAAADLRLLFERAPEILAAIVLSKTGEPIVGAGRRDVCTLANCTALVKRRKQVFSVPMFETSPGEARGTQASALGFDLRTVVTGEGSFWCFGAELIQVGGRTLWMLTDRKVAQGIGWACLTTLTRSLSNAETIPPARSAQ